jgi:hypothetical protein
VIKRVPLLANKNSKSRRMRPHADIHSDTRPRFNASVLVWRVIFWSFLVASMLQELFVSTIVHPKVPKSHRMRPHADIHSDTRPRFNAFVLVWRVIFWSFLVASMLQEIFVSTIVHPKVPKSHHMRPQANIQSDTRPRFNALVLDWRILYWSVLVAWMLHDLFFGNEGCGFSHNLRL